MKIEGILQIKTTDYDNCVQTEYVAVDNDNLSYLINEFDGKKVIINIEVINN